MLVVLDCMRKGGGVCTEYVRSKSGDIVTVVSYLGEFTSFSVSFVTCQEVCLDSVALGKSSRVTWREDF